MKLSFPILQQKTATNLFRLPKKCLPYAAALLLTGTLAGCNRLEKNKTENSEQEININNDNKFNSQINNKTNDTVYYNKYGELINEYDQDSCHITRKYNKEGNLARVEKVRMNKKTNVNTWYKSVTTYNGSGDSCEIQSHYSTVNGKTVHPDSIITKYELVKAYWAKDLFGKSSKPAKNH